MPDYRSTSQKTTTGPYRIGAVSFFNAKPLIFNLERHPDVNLLTHVPAQLTDALNQNQLDIALVPSIDYQRTTQNWQILPVGCIASDGPVLTVQIFSQLPPDQIDHVAVDPDSHTSVTLAKLIWKIKYHKTLTVSPISGNPDQYPAVLLIGDKVLDHLNKWPYQTDLGNAWTQRTSLPFVYAFWALPANTNPQPLAQILQNAAQQGQKNIQKIIDQHAPNHGFNSALAHRYLTTHIQYTLGPQQIQALEHFYQLAAHHQLISTPRPLKCLHIHPQPSINTPKKPCSTKPE